MCSDKDKSGKRVESEQRSPTVGSGDSKLDPHTGPTSYETPQSQPDPAGTPTDATAKGVRRPSSSKAAGGNKGVKASLPTNPKSPRPDGKSFSSPVISGDPSVNPTEIDDFSRVKESDAPDESWATAELFSYVENVSRKLKSIEGRKLKAGVEEAVLTYDLGCGLFHLKEKFGRRGWGVQLKARGISTSKDWRSRMLFERAGSRQAVEGLSVNQAYKKFGVHKEQAGQSLDRQLTALAKRVAKITGKQVDVDRCRSTIEFLKASLDALLRPGGESGDSAGAPVPT